MTRQPEKETLQPVWLRPAAVAESIVPHRVPFPLARRFQQVCTTIIAEAYADEGLRSMTYTALACVDDFPGIDQRHLAALMGVDRTNAGQIVDELEAKGLIERHINGADRRARELRLTRDGERKRRQLRPKLLAAQARMLAPLTAAEQDMLIELLIRVVEANEAHARPGAGRRPPRRKATSTSTGATHDQARNAAAARIRDRPSARRPRTGHSG
jgi:DNA-binding MarR family transcriptional regulator